jgi:alpha-ketoglutarate-dependent taurine dioxygenase
MNTRLLAPFGVEVTAERTPRLGELDISDLKRWITEHRLAVLRGFAVGGGGEMTAFCEKLGEILEWEFGSVNELQAQADARNYLYTTRAVPMHWDGAFAARVPHYIFFHCVAAPPEGSGGETTFCDTTKLLGEVIRPEVARAWEDVAITYRTEKVVHYGGRFTANLFDRHAVHGYPVVRYAEPVEDLNPVTLEVAGLPDGDAPGFIDDMRRMLYDARCLLAHGWRANDVVIADNHALLHGRRAFAHPAARHLRRVNIL